MEPNKTEFAERLAAAMQAAGYEPKPAVLEREFNQRYWGKPITLQEHQASRWICEPLHLLDCCQESDGAVAMVITSVERARDLKQKPVIIKGAAQGISDGQQIMTSYFRQDITGLPEMGLVAKQLWQQSGLSAVDIQTAVIYDHFTPFVLPQL